MTTAQVVETSVTNNSLSKDYPHLDDHAKQISCRSYQFMHCVLLRYAHVILDMMSYRAFLTTVKCAYIVLSGYAHISYA